MKSFKHITITALTVVGLFSAVLYTSCSKSTTAPDAAYLGAYSTTETCNPSVTQPTFSNTITSSSTSNSTIVISNFGASGNSVTGTVSGNSVTLSPTTFNTSTGGSYTVNGNGTLNGNILTIYYNFSNGVSYTCTDVMTKQ
ncbi:MAG: hypothetical protein H0X33_12855 [Taibaiella sp.]|nr:hypothetical protein [Taibaiella sp.]